MRHMEYMLWPRAMAISEALWSSKEKRNWNDFKKRMSKQFKRFDHRKINYAKTSLDIGLEKK